MNSFDPDFIPASCRGEVCSCGEQARHKVAEVFFDDDPTAWRKVEFQDGQRITTSVRHPSTAYVCSKCFGKIMGRTTIPGFKNET